MNKQQIKQTIDATSNQFIIEADINIYESDIRQLAQSFLTKVAAESRRQKRSKIKLIGILEA